MFIAISFIRNRIAFGDSILSSSVIETSALLLPNSPQSWNMPFLNSVVLLKTNLSFLQVFEEIKKIEAKMGRDFCSGRWSPREIDIDIITYNNLVYSNSEIDLQIPHVQMHKRHFVLEPLCEIVPNNIHPIFEKSFKDLLRELSC